MASRLDQAREDANRYATAHIGVEPVAYHHDLRTVTWIRVRVRLRLRVRVSVRVRLGLNPNPNP